MHGDLWLDLDGLFAEPERVRPWAAELARRLASHAPEVICGPETGGAILARLVADELGVGVCAVERIAASTDSGQRAVVEPAPSAERLPETTPDRRGAVERSPSAQRLTAPTEGGAAAVAYRIPREDRAGLRGRRAAVVDDAINAGFAAAAVLRELEMCGAVCTALGALLVLNDGAANLAARHAVPLESLVRVSAGLWRLDECPLCRGRVPLEAAAGQQGGSARGAVR